MNRGVCPNTRAGAGKKSDGHPDFEPALPVKVQNHKVVERETAQHHHVP